jgi:pectate lyase
MNQLRQYGLAGAAIAIASLLSACGGSSSGSNDTPAIPTPIPTSAPGTPLTASYEVTGWASQGNGTTGGATAPASNIYIVRNRAELKAALANSNSATYASNPTAAKLEPKTIYVMGSIYGTDLGNGQLANEAYYKTLTTTYKNINNWDFENYIGYVSAQASGGTATTEQTAAASARQTMQNAQKAQIEFTVPSNTTLMGVGTNAKLIDGYLNINAQSNIVIRNIEFEAPIDLAPSYDWERARKSGMHASKPSAWSPASRSGSTIAPLVMVPIKTPKNAPSMA